MGRFNVGAVALASMILQSLTTLPATAQNSPRYNACSAQAAQQSGWNGSNQSGSQHAPLAGAAGGAIGGSLIGGMGGGNSGRGAAIGAVFGVVAGAARKSEAAKKQQSSESNYYNALNACLSQ
jgi:hypothetical protein